MKCPKCAHENTVQNATPDENCPQCGVVYAKIELNCPRCRHVAKGLEIQKPGVCPECGANVEEFLKSRSQSATNSTVPATNNRLEEAEPQKKSSNLNRYLPGAIAIGVLLYFEITRSIFLSIAALVALSMPFWLPKMLENRKRKRLKQELEEAEAEFAKLVAQRQEQVDKAEVEAAKLLRDGVEIFTRLHAPALLKARKQKIYIDDYGIVINAAWRREQDYFLDNVFLAQLPSAAFKEGWKDMAYKYIDEMLDSYTGELGHSIEPHGNIEDLSPIEFEHWCADVMRANGWNARVTQASGDQGIDVIASRNGGKLVIQCKKYSQPIGNAAVQEIIAGKNFEGADVGVVVSNQAYTRSAKQLAATTDVVLLHHTELDSFAKTFCFNSSAA